MQRAFLNQIKEAGPRVYHLAPETEGELLSIY